MLSPLVDTWAHDTVMWYWTADTLFWQFSIDKTWMCNIRLQAPTLAKKCKILHWLPCDADGQSRDYQMATYGHVSTKISKMDRQPNFLGCGALLVRASRMHGAPLLKTTVEHWWVNVAQGSKLFWGCFTLFKDQRGEDRDQYTAMLLKWIGHFKDLL